MVNTLNQNVEYSASKGGARNVYSGLTVKNLPGGYDATIADLPINGNVLPAGSPILPNDLDHSLKIHYAFEVYENVAADGKTVKVKKYGEGTRSKKDMVIMVCPEDITESGTAVKIIEINSENDEFDVLTLSATLGTLTKGTVLVEGTAVGASSKIAVLPTATTYADTVVAYGNGIVVKSVNVDAAHFSDGVLYTRRIPPIAEPIRKYMYANGYNIRFFNGK